MDLHISTSDGLPIYQQIVQQIRYLIGAGRLDTGQELPPIRALAQQLTVNPNTVARAYRELEVAGLVEKRGTTGTFVSSTGSPLARREKTKILTQRIDQLLAESSQMGFDCNELIELVRRRHRVFAQNGKGEKS